MYILQIRKLLPPSQTPLQKIGEMNIFSVTEIALVHLGVFWFVVHVYTTEVETRQSLQQELHLFERLSHEIRTPVTVC